MMPQRCVLYAIYIYRAASTTFEGKCPRPWRPLRGSRSSEDILVQAHQALQTQRLNSLASSFLDPKISEYSAGSLM